MKVKSTGSVVGMVVNIRHVDRDEYDVYVGRGKSSCWGNPYVIGKDGNREEVIAKYRALLWKRVNGKHGDKWIRALADLDGKVLGCYCAPAPCHADVLVRAAAWAKALTEAGTERTVH